MCDFRDRADVSANDLLRYWEAEIGCLRPMKTRGAHRQYRLLILARELAAGGPGRLAAGRDVRVLGEPERLEAEILGKARELGAKALFRKPVDATALVDSIAWFTRETRPR